MIKGKILKAISGFYYVKTEDAIYECKARGSFRNSKISPLAGDDVLITPDGEKGVIEEICERKNSFIRPPVANIDQFIIVVSSKQPKPNYFVIDKLISIAEYKGVEPILAFTKVDLHMDRESIAIYEKAGFTCVVADYENEASDWKTSLLDLLKDKTTVFIGNSGVGKSTLLNHLGFGLELKTAQISEKLGRGRHTTRHVEIFPLNFGGFVADTPGFSDVDLHKTEGIMKEELFATFREFADFADDCRFLDCSHTRELGCSVLQAVKQGDIPASRHESYLALYEQLRPLESWQLKKK